MKKIVITFLSFVISIVVQAKVVPIFNASFDCKKAKTASEIKICNSADLADLDLILSKIYRKKINANIIADQKAWLKKRNDCIGLLPADEDQCFFDSYIIRIKELDGVGELIKYYQAGCQKDVSKCEELGNFEFELGMWKEAASDLSAICEADRDGDMGYSCYKKAFAFEKLGKKTEAINLYNKTCISRSNNLACAGAYRLKGIKNKNPWVGLYRNSTGTIFVDELSDKKISINADTNWANGHYCGWNKQGKILNDKMILEIDKDTPDCKPIIERLGSKIKVQDPNLACKYAYCGARALFEGEFELDQKSGP